MPLLEAAREAAVRHGVPEARIREWADAIPEKLLEASNRHRFNRTFLTAALGNPRSWVDALEVPAGAPTLKWDRLIRLLDATRDVLGEERVRFAVAYLPAPLQHDPEIWKYFPAVGYEIHRGWMSGLSPFEARLADWAEARGVPFKSLTLDFQRASRERPGAFNFPLDGHWNPEGHRLAADRLAAWLREEVLPR
jgi:hypothetical protein